MRSKGEIEERIEILCRGTGRRYDEVTCVWHDETERELMRNELLWVIHGSKTN